MPQVPALATGGHPTNVEAAERAAQAHYGPNVGIRGQCEHQTRVGQRWGVASIATCNLWEASARGFNAEPEP